MAAMTAALVGGSLLAGGMSIWQAQKQADAMRMQGEFQERTAEFNTKLSEMQAEDAVRRGNTEIVAHQAQARQIVGMQRVALAAQGIDVNKDSAYAVQDETRRVSKHDTMTIKNNALREAFGYKVQAANASAQGVISSIAAQNNADNTILTGYTNALSHGINAASYGRKA